MVGHIYIYGDIGKTGMDNGNGFIELEDVMAQVHKAQRQGDVSEWLVHVKSPGGLKHVGDKIYDYLNELKDKNTVVNSITDGDVGSIATKIFLVGQNRTIVGNHEFFIHNPWIDGVTGEAKDFEDIGAEMREMEDELAKFYADITGHKKGGILSLMEDGSGIRGQMAVDLGFATQHKQDVQVKVFAMTKPVEEKKHKQTKSTKTKKMSKYKKFKSMVSKLVEALENNEVKDLDIPMPEGATIRIADAETEEMAAGKAAILVAADGSEQQAPEGEHMTADGRTVVVDTDGMIVSISAPENEMEALKNKIKELEGKLAAKEKKEEDVDSEDLKVLLKDMKKATKKAKKKEAEFLALQQEMRAIKTEYKIPENKVFNKGVDRKNEGPSLKERLIQRDKERQEKIEKKKQAAKA
jgi:ATP-dependent protease ClpP protease subunit